MSERNVDSLPLYQMNMLCIKHILLHIQNFPENLSTTRLKVVIFPIIHYMYLCLCLLVLVNYVSL